MDSLFSFPVEDDRLLFQAGGGGGYDFPIFDDLMLQEQMFDAVDWECAANFGVLGAVDANPDGIPLVEASHGGGAADRADMMKPSRDRSKTIVSERKRRGRMKERLYELRSMVPNITKMDKSSIIGDAVAYVRELQGQEKKLAEEIRNFESSSTCSRRAATAAKEEEKRIYRGKILGVMAHQVREKRFQVVIECSGEDGASASSLYNAVHALECFRLESAAIARASDRYVCTLTFDGNVGGDECCNDEVLGGGFSSQRRLPLHHKFNLDSVWRGGGRHEHGGFELSFVNRPTLPKD